MAAWMLQGPVLSVPAAVKKPQQLKLVASDAQCRLGHVEEADTGCAKISIHAAAARDNTVASFSFKRRLILFTSLPFIFFPL
jgi:hypothetical protein